MKRIFGNVWPVATQQLSPEPAPVHVKRNISINYPPILDQAEFKAANEKLAQFSSQRAELQTKLDKLQADYAASLKVPHTDDSADHIGQAEQILSGDHAQSTLEQIETLSKDVAILARAETAQRKIVKAINDDLSRQAATRFADQHRAAVARLKEAIEELHAANRAEAVIRDDLVALGYMGATLPHMGYEEAHDPTDSTGSAAFYWLRSTSEYLQSPEQKATATRKSRLTSLTA